MKFIFSFFVILLFLTCDKKRESKTILHISHTRTDVEGEAPEILKTIDFSQFDVLCLGGDLDLSTSNNESTMDYWNDIFPFAASTTLWTLGNHDTANRSRITAYTKRPSFYTYTKDKVTYLVLDTQLNESNMVGDQLAMVHAVTDTISESAVLVVLSHKLFWMPGNQILESQTNDIANGPLGTCGYCTQVNNFYTDIYPRLIEVINKNIQVLCIAGDIGFKTQEFEFQTSEGIYFLASGIDTRKKEIKALLLEYQEKDRILEWRYEALRNL